MVRTPLNDPDEARESRPSRHAETSDQLRLFDPPERQRRPATPRHPAGLGADDEGLWSREVSLHSREKAHYVRRYADIVATSMRGKWRAGVWWIELFAGPGRLFERETREYLRGSPVDAVSIPRPFDGYVFIDLGLDCVESLRARVGDRPSVHVVHGDANDQRTHDEVAKIVPDGALVEVYADQEGLDFFWPSLEFFIRRYRSVDFLINLPTSGGARALGGGYEDKVGFVLGEEDVRKRLAEIETRRESDAIRRTYLAKLAAEGFEHDSVPVAVSGTQVALYDLVVASRKQLAIHFFHEAVGIDSGGQYAMKFA